MLSSVSKIRLSFYPKTPRPRVTDSPCGRAGSCGTFGRNKCRAGRSIGRGQHPREVFMPRKSLYASVAVIALTVGLAGMPAPVRAQQPNAAIQVGAADIGGTVTGPSGPEAGVWVIAETTDLPTIFTKIVVTDDAGRYLIPDLPKAKYSVWVRGYGLVDSQKVSSETGKTLNLTAAKAPSEAAAAQYYAGMDWYSMLKIPPASDFPGTGAKGNGIPEFIKSQHAWIDTVKNACQSCHAIGTKGVRTISPKLGEFKDSKEAWTRRRPSRQSMGNMSMVIVRLSPEKWLLRYADWSRRIA